MKKSGKEKMIEKFSKDGLVGNCFHSIDEEGKIQWQGRVLSSPKQDWYLIQTYEWLMGEPHDRKLVHFDKMVNWLFYENENDMRFAAEHGSAKHLRHL
jgi:hypothetical protein